jgi:SEC-C motif
MPASAESAVDQAQLVRIENVHGGFLYQHLYTTSVLLQSASLNWTCINIEHDEDLEILSANFHLYVQVKKRSGRLTFSDIEDAITRFNVIRDFHIEQQRSGTPQLWVVCNSVLGPDLTSRLARSDWPTDVFLRTPGVCSGNPDLLPIPAADIVEAVARCVALARQVPHSTLSPETLVWKLAAWVQLIASGTVNNHRITAAELVPLLEQLVVQLQQFPATVTNYRPHENEPLLVSSVPVRLIVGFSGSGKTSWAAEVDSHQAGVPVYFDVSDLPGSGVASSLVRELAARLLPADTDERQAILLPGVIGLQALRLIDRYISSISANVTIFLDNAHRMSNTDITEVITALGHVKWIVLAQPWPGMAHIEGRFGIVQERLSGWSIATISKEVELAECFASPATCEWLRGITGGLPLFVRDTCRIAKLEYSGDIEACCRAIVDLVTVHTTSQEVIATEVFRRLSAPARQCAAILSLATMSLDREQVFSMIAAGTSENPRWAAKCLRELSDWGIVQHLRNGEIRLHDMFSVLATGERDQLSSDVLMRGREALLTRLLRMEKGGGVEQFRLICRLLLDTGRIEELIDVATGNAEMISEYGIAEETSELIREAASSPILSAENRFWAQDTLAFWAIQAGEFDSAAGLIDQMTSEANRFQPTSRARMALAVKRLMITGLRGQLGALRAAYRGFDLANADEETSRIVRYNYALALRKCNRPKETVKLTGQLITEYYDALEIELEDVMFKNLPDIANSLGDVPAKADHLKHLADCLDLQATALLDLGSGSRFARIHAHKFYVLSDALSSAVRVGQDFVDECLRIGSDPVGARMFIEQSLLPVVRERKLLSKLVPVSCQYAVVLAYCGEYRAARRTLAEMRSFIVPDTLQADEFEEQTNLVEAIASGEVTLNGLNEELLLHESLRHARVRGQKIGRNEPCPCGSGKKYKKCHGA